MDAPAPKIPLDPPSTLIYRLATAMAAEDKARREVQDAAALVRSIAGQLAPALPPGRTVRVIVPFLGDEKTVIELTRTVPVDDTPRAAVVLAQYADTITPSDLHWPGCPAGGLRLTPDPALVAEWQVP